MHKPYLFIYLYRYEIAQQQQQQHSDAIISLLQVMSTPLPGPPDAALHPVLAFEAFLQSLETSHCQPEGTITISNNDVNSRNDADNCSDYVPNSGQYLTRKQELLKMADYLFGSMLEGALSTLYSYVITEIQSVQSRRRMFVLANPYAKSSSKRQDEPQTYLCILPQSAQPSTEESEQNKISSINNVDVASISGGAVQFHFCSCRSYFERTKSLLGTDNLPQKKLRPQCHSLCKHLLALKLRPFLLESCEKIEAVTEEQFSQELLKRLLRESG